jgi:hypothetical protein
MRGGHDLCLRRILLFGFVDAHMRVRFLLLVFNLPVLLFQDGRDLRLGLERFLRHFVDVFGLYDRLLGGLDSHNGRRYGRVFFVQDARIAARYFACAPKLFVSSRIA